MLHVDLPCITEITKLANIQSDACISIFINTSHLREELNASKIELSNKAKEAYQQLRDNHFDKRRLLLIEQQIDELIEDFHFWRLHSSSLAIFVTPDSLVTYRLPNDLTPRVEVSEHFYIKPLLRSLTFSHAADILVLSENCVRFIEVFEDGKAVEDTIPELPTTGMFELLKNPEGIGQVAMHKEEARLVQYVRYINQVLRPYYLHNEHHPLILVATDYLAALFKRHYSLSNLLDQHVNLSGDQTPVKEIVERVRPILEAHHQNKLAQALALVHERNRQNRAVYDLTDIARLVTIGAVETLLFDIDASVPGCICENGTIAFAEQASAKKGDVIDEITKRALETGAKIVAVRKNDLPEHAKYAAATLRYVV